MGEHGLKRGVRYGASFDGTASTDAFMGLVLRLDGLGVDDLLLLPYRVGDDPSILSSRLESLSVERFKGLVAVSVLGVSCTDDALYACLSLRDALDFPDLAVVVVVSSERKAELAKALAIGGFSDLPSR